MTRRLLTGWSCGSTLFLLFFFVNPAYAEVDLFSRTQTQLVSELESLDSTIDDWGSELQRGERQWAVSRFELGARYSGVELSVQRRALADLRFNADAAEFYSRVEAEVALTPGETVPARITINGFSAKGLRLGYRYSAANWTLGAGMTWLKTTHLMSGELQGQFTAVAVDEYSVEADVDYFYYRDIIFKRPNINTSEGEGKAFDVTLAWQLSERWQLDMEAEDLFTEIHWTDAPYTTATARSDRKSYDEDGYAFFNPLFSGRQGYRDTFVQQIDPRYKLGARYTRGAWSAQLKGQHQFGYGFAGIGAGYQFSSGSVVKALVWPELDSVEVELKYGQWSAGLMLDHISWPKMHALSLNLSYGY